MLITIVMTLFNVLYSIYIHPTQVWLLKLIVSFLIILAYIHGGDMIQHTDSVRPVQEPGNLVLLYIQTFECSQEEMCHHNIIIIPYSHKINNNFSAAPIYVHTQ